jgi:predicted dehydrogenase
MPLRAAIVGAGLMGRWHAHAVARLGHVVGVIVDPDSSRATALAQRHRGAEWHASLSDAVTPVDVVHVCTPLASHRGLIEEALARGCHVIAEKPLAPSAGETEQLLCLAADGGRMLVPVHQALFQRGVLRATELLPSIGPLLHFESSACTAGADGRSPAGRDDVALEILPHPLSLVCRMISPDMGEAQWHVRRAHAGEVRADGIVAGTTVSLLVSTRGRPTTNTVCVIGEHGTVQLDLFHGFAVHLRGRATRASKIAQPFLAGAGVLAAATLNLGRRVAQREPAYPGLTELIRRTYAAAAGSGAAPVSPAETLSVATARDQIAREMAHTRPSVLAGSSVTG